MARIVLLGADGQVGWELRRSLLPLGEVVGLTRKNCDLANKDKLVEAVRDLSPGIIVNAAAYTAVDKAEQEITAAQCINADTPAILAEEARRLDALLVDYSTDYVFDGTKDGPYVETDPTSPVNVYGRTKLSGQHAIEQSGCRHLIFRVSWVYAARGSNFLRTMLHLGRQRDELRVVSDQVGSPTPADLVADVTAQALSLMGAGKGEEGLFNLVPSGETSWHGFADELFRHYSLISGSSGPSVTPIRTSEYPTAAKRPLNSRLDTTKLAQTFGFAMPDWRIPMKRIVEEVVSR